MPLRPVKSGSSRTESSKIDSSEVLINTIFDPTHFTTLCLLSEWSGKTDSRVSELTLVV